MVIARHRLYSVDYVVSEQVVKPREGLHGCSDTLNSAPGHSVWHSGNATSKPVDCMQCCIQCNSSLLASEQLFSAAEQIYSDCHRSLLGENAEKLLFLAYNI